MFISFDNPYYLLFFVVVPFLIFFHFFSLKKIRRSSLKFANFDAIARVKGIDLYSKKISILILNVILVSLLILSLSGFNFHKEVFASGFSFVVVLDSSESMTASDVSLNRISVAKDTANEFIDMLPYESYVGVVSFSGDSYIEQDITKNKQLLKDSINQIEISNSDGTNVHGAILTSGEILDKESNKAVILLSDGQINVGSIDDAIEYAERNQVMLHTLLIGTKEGGETEYFISKADEQSMQSLAYNTGGRYYDVENKTSLSEAFSEILLLKEKKVAIDLTSYLLILAIIIFILKFFLINTRYVSLP